MVCVSRVGGERMHTKAEVVHRPVYGARAVAATVRPRHTVGTRHRYVAAQRDTQRTFQLHHIFPQQGSGILTPPPCNPPEPRIAGFNTEETPPHSPNIPIVPMIPTQWYSKNSNKNFPEEPKIAISAKVFYLRVEVF